MCLAGNSHVYIELWHAALAGSAVINPLNTRLAPEEIVYILTDSATEVVFTDAAHAGTIAGVRERLPLLRKVDPDRRRRRVRATIGSTT